MAAADAALPLAETEFILQSERGHLLLRSCYISRLGGHDVTIVLNHLEPLLEDELELVDGLRRSVEFIGELKTVKRITVLLPINGQFPPFLRRELNMRVGLALVKAYQESTAIILDVVIDSLDFQEHLDFFTHPACKDVITNLTLYGWLGISDPSGGERTKTALESLTNLNCFTTLTPQASTRSISFLLSSTVTLPNLRKIGVGMSMATEDHVREFVKLLRNRPQIERVHISELSRSCYALLLNVITKESGPKLKEFELIQTIPIPVDAAVIMGRIITNLSPQLKKLTLTIRIDETAKNQVKGKLLLATNQNTDLLSLEYFKFMAHPEADEELSSICRAFAVRKTVERSAVGGRLPLAILPLALNGIQSHPDLNYDNKKKCIANILFQCLKNHGPDIIIGNRRKRRHGQA